ncbi:alpha/beta hydrolase fold protein [Halalkaliarchaeum desulfuricum]|uniref:Alpha/beta hydrolase fold protein n=1 Tax=Halalkaliarchaeum desulfuricum TaxID=2055893 RepID=A0A343TFW6_9EURY|nr:alpha/beta hydrolase [Halalkaliarchaeum desulfuricum]AUX07988.1 alpha/beta hydrolase fold protein [Halalkaliarchaeum desulfuricum]
MNFRRIASYATLAAGALAATNRGLRRTEPLDPPLPGEQRSYRWRGMEIAHTLAGDPGDPTLVLLHGTSAVASSGEWREVFGRLAEEYHVVAPDLPGFGCSDRPRIDYTPELYVDFIREFLEPYDEPAVLASSLTGAYAVAAAEDVDVSRLFLVCPSATGGPEPPKAWLRELLWTPVIGEALFNLSVSEPAIRYFNADHGYYDPAKLTDEWVEYEWQTGHRPNARFAPAAFLSGYLNVDIDLGAALAELDVPATVIWGREAEVSPLSRGREIAETADARLVVFDDAKLLPHVEYPDQFVDEIRTSMESE